LAAFVDVPVVHFSVEWWRTLHQKGTVFNRELNPTIQGNLAWALLSGVFAFTCLYLYLLERRYRLAVMEEAIEERALDAAIAERRAEIDVPPLKVPS
ncbi:MAG TPA: cytochrome C biogenesis protein, partial [Acidimicrobiia bacterium]|nr:cytochrome C biogenesis protein [Acidimicrobiia bacterium]